MTTTDGSHRVMRPVTLRYWAGARATAGVAEETTAAALEEMTRAGAILG